MIVLVPARRSCPVSLLPGPSGIVPLTKCSFVSQFRACLSVFHMSIVSEVTPSVAARPLGRLVAACPANLCNYTVIGPVILISFI